MSERMNIMVARKGAGEKTFWHRVGTAFEGQKGWQLVFDSLPVPDEKGQVRAYLFPQEQRQSSDPADVPF